MNKALIKNILSHIYAFIVLLLLWTLLHTYVGETMVPSPLEVLKTSINLLQTDFYLHILYSIYRIIISIGISILIGVPIGIFIGMNKIANQIISPIIYLIYPIPKIAFLPIFMILFGIGEKSKIILMITIILFQMLIVTRDSVLQIDETVLMSAKIMKFSNLNLCFDVIIPAILPKLFSALRISVGISISALFFSENYATKYGIGYFIMNSWSMVDYKEMFVGVVALSLMALAIYKVIDLLEKITCPWNNQ